MGSREEREEVESSKNDKRGRRREKTGTDFKEAACYPSAVVQVQNGKKMVCARGVPGVTETLGKPNSHFDPT